MVGLEIASHEQHALSVGLEPEHPVALHPHIDDPANRALDSAAANGNSEGLEELVPHPIPIALEVVAMFQNLLAPASDGQRVDVPK